MRCLFLRIFTLCLALCTCTACQTTTPYSMDTDSLFSEDFSSSISDSTKTESDIWQVQDVDVSRVNPDYKLVALTFDDAPSPTLERLISVFASFNENNPDCPAYATLFCNGIRIRNASLHALASAYSLGWELGNHGYSHNDFTTMTEQEIQQEMQSTDSLLNNVDRQDKHLFRPPFGNLQNETKRRLDVPIMYWTVDTLDWTGIESTTIKRTVMHSIRDGDIILLHDGYEQTVQAVKQLLPALKENGYQAVTLSQMAKVHQCNLYNGGAYIRIRKPKALR